MTALVLRTSAPIQSTPSVVLPLPGSPNRVPSPVLVAQRLSGLSRLERDGVRAGIAVGTAVGEIVRHQHAEPGGGTRWDRAVEVNFAEIERLSGLSQAEAGQGIEQLVESGALQRLPSEQVRFDAGVIANLPGLAQLDWEEVRRRLRDAKANLAPGLSVMREIARRTQVDSHGRPSWITCGLEDLIQSALWSRSPVSRALGDLEQTGCIERQPTRGLKLRLSAVVLGRRTSAAPPRDSAPGSSPTPSTGTHVQFGSHPVELPPGTPIRLEDLGGGASRMHLGPLTIETAADGSQVARYGALTLRP